MECSIYSDDNKESDDPSDELFPKQVTDSDTYKLFNWTFCYNDGCLLYFSEKKYLGWFPKQLWRKKQLAIERYGLLYNTVMRDSDSDCFSTDVFDRAVCSLKEEEEEEESDFVAKAN